MSREQSKVLAAAATGIRDQVDTQGGDPDEVLSRSGINAAHLRDYRARLDLRSYVRLMELAAEHTDNDNFGLHYGLRFTPEMLGLIGAAPLACANLGMALATLAELFPYHQQATETRVVSEASYIRLEYRILDGAIVDRRQDAELTLGMFLNIIRRSLGARWAPEEIHCEHPRPDGWKEHERFFEAPVLFSQRTNAIVLRKDSLAAAMPDANPVALAGLRTELTAITADRAALSFSDRVMGEVRSSLVAGGTDIEEVARALGMARWTLQRRLAEEGVNFSDIIDRIRRELAERYLCQRDLQLTEIAFLLGYSELSAFSRAYRRWHGEAPRGRATLMRRPTLPRQKIFSIVTP